MPTLTCENCSRTLTIPDGLLGGTIRCPNCDTVQATSAADSAITLDEPTSNTKPALGEREAPSSSGGGLAPPGYTVLDELGRGGMGVVYKAKHAKLDRVVALKMILAGAHATSSERRRFQNEAEVIARLQHPGIVQVFEVGDHDGKPFVSLEYCGGGSLDGQLDGTPMQPMDAADLIRQLSEAVQTAHDADVVHRDLKPANVLLGADDTPKITDFGLAKKLDEQGQTLSGTVMGTPSYMAPEQARGATDIGSAADIYALGAILYECLTGRPPFRAATTFDTISQVIDDEPVRPFQLNATVPGDLETIALKCLEKNPAKRYRSAADLGDELTRYLEGRPILARPVGVVGRTVKWVRRNPLVASLVGLVFLASTVGTVVSILFGLSARTQARLADDRARQLGVEKARVEREKSRAEAEKTRAEEQKGRAEREKTRAEEQQTRAEEESKRALLQERRAVDALARERSLSYFLKVSLADVERKAGNPERAKKYLSECSPRGREPDLRGWEWFYLDRLCSSGSRPVFRARGTVVRLISLADGKRVLVGTGHTSLFDLEGRRVIRVFGNQRYSGGAAALSADETLLLQPTSVGKSTLFEFPSGKKLYEVSGRGPGAFHPSRKSMALWSGAGSVVLLDTADGNEVRKMEGNVPRFVSSIAFSPDGKYLAVAAYTGNSLVPGQTFVWTVADGKRVATLTGHARNHSFLDWSPTSDLLATSSLDGTARIWSAKDWSEVSVLRGHDGPVHRVAFHPDGALVVTAGQDRTLRGWEAKTGASRFVLHGSTDPITALAWSPAGTWLITGEQRMQVRLWDDVGDREVKRWSGYKDSIRSVAFDSKGGRIVVGGVESKLRVRDVATGKVLMSTAKLPRYIAGVAYHPGGELVACIDDARVIRVYEVSTGKLRVTLPGNTKDTGGRSALAFSPDGKLLVAPNGKHAVKVWETATWKEVAECKGHTNWVEGVNFGPTGKRVASSSQDGTVRVWDARTGQPIHVLKMPRFSRHTRNVSFSRDGSLLAAATMQHPSGGQVLVWEADSGKLSATFRGHAHWATGVAFSPDGGRLASVSQDGTLRLWDLKTRQEAFMIRANSAGLNDVAWSRDGKRIAAAGQDGVEMVWHADDVPAPAKGR